MENVIVFLAAPLPRDLEVSVPVGQLHRFSDSEWSVRDGEVLVNIDFIDVDALSREYGDDFQQIEQALACRPVEALSIHYSSSSSSHRVAHAIARELAGRYGGVIDLNEGAALQLVKPQIS